MTTDLQPEQARQRKYPLLLVLAALFVYWNSFGGTYFLDDHAWIVSNPKIGDPWSFFLGRRILVSLSLTLNYWLDGTNPRLYHVVNFAIHVAAGLALYGIVRRTLLLPRWSERVRNRAAAAAFAVALLWLLHPLNTAAVTYLIQRCESMMGMFYLLTVYTMLRGATAARGRWWYLLSCLSCAAGVLCKEVILTAPVVVLLFDWMFLAPSVRELVRRRWAYYVGLVAPLAAFSAVMTLTGGLTQKGSSLGFGYLGFGPVDYALTQTGVLLYYIRLSVWPWPLCIDYLDWPIVHSLADCWLSATVVAAMLLAVVVLVARRHWLGFLGAWFFLILAPSSSIMPIQDAVFEHRMYLSLAAVVALGVAGAVALLDGAAARLRLSTALQRRAAGALLAAALVFFGSFTIARNAQYCSFGLMMKYVVAERPGNYRARDTLAQFYFANNQLEDARDQLREAVRLRPSYFTIYNTAGNCLLRKGELDDAVKMFQTAVQLKPGFQGDVYTASLGRALLLRGEADAALERLTEAIAENPLNSRYRVLRAIALDHLGRRDEADAEYAAAFRQDHGLPRSLNRDARGSLFTPDANPVMLREALWLAEAACRMSDDREAEYLDTLAEAFAASGQFDDARDVCQQAIDRAAAAGQDDLAEQMRGRLHLYEQQHPYTEATAS